LTEERSELVLSLRMGAHACRRLRPAIANFLFLGCLTEIGGHLTRSFPLSRPLGFAHRCLPRPSLSGGGSLAPQRLRSANWARAAWRSSHGWSLGLPGSPKLRWAGRRRLSS